MAKKLSKKVKVNEADLSIENNQNHEVKTTTSAASKKQKAVVKR